jgi:hypothetical protein
VRVRVRAEAKVKARRRDSVGTDGWAGMRSAQRRDSGYKYVGRQAGRQTGRRSRGDGLHARRRVAGAQRAGRCRARDVGEGGAAAWLGTGYGIWDIGCGIVDKDVKDV